MAKLRAELFAQDERVQLKAIGSATQANAGNLVKAKELGQMFGMDAHEYWSDLVVRPDLDLIVVATINRDHGTVVSKALRSGKHVIVEYPLSFSLSEATELLQLAQQKQLMLHVEHIELLGGVHQAAAEALPRVGKPFYARYATQNPQTPAPDKWTYMPDLFGFPLIAAVSRIHRLTAMFGQVKSVSCQLRYEGVNLPKRFTSCVCNAQLQFENGLIADVSYSKGENVWKPERSLEIQGSKGAIVFEAENGKLITANGEETLPAGPSRGLFKKDTENVLSHLFNGTPLYVTPTSALHALAVACAAEKAAKTNQVIDI